MASRGPFQPYKQTLKDTVPESTAGVGTISSSGVGVKGTPSVAQADTTTLTGTSGSAAITVEGKEKVFPFALSESQTA